MAATTASSSEAEQDSDSGPMCQDTILGDVDAQTRFETTYEQFNDPPLSKVNTFRSGDDNMKILELMEIFAKTHNVVAFLEKPAESDGYTEIIDFLKASSVSYALTVNPIIYTSCIQQFWATAQVKMVNGVCQLQALIDKKKVIITEASIRNDLHLDDAEGTDCLPNTTNFEELAKMGYEKPSQKLTFYKAFFSPQWKFMIHTITQSLSAKSTAWNEFSNTMASLIICLATNRKFNLSKYIFDAMVKHLDGGVKFLLKVTPLFDSILVQATEEVGEDLIPPTDSTQIPIIDQPSTSSQPKKKQKSRRKQRKEAETAHAKTEEEEHFYTPSNDPLPSCEDSMQLNELMDLCTQLKQQVLDLEKAKSNQAIEIASLKKRVDKLEKRRQRMHPNRRGVLRILMQMLSTAGETVTTASVEDSAAPIIQVSTADIGEVTTAKIDELTLAQTLIEIKAAKPKVVTTAATTTTTTRPKGKGVVVQEPSEFRVPQESQPLISKDKGKAKLDAELRRAKLARKLEKIDQLDWIESWENTQAMMEADRLLRPSLSPDSYKAQKRTQMSTYLKYMGGYTYKQLKGKSCNEIQKLFDKEMKRVNTFVAMGSEVQESKEKKEECREETDKGSRKKMLGRKRAGKQQQKESSKKQKVEEEKESEEVDEVELKKLLADFNIGMRF
ncbi:hypothetical protein Tco_0572906 [Tanacetum coccineum]